MSGTEIAYDIIVAERELEDAKVAAAIQANGPFAKHARQKVERLKRDLCRLHHPSNWPLTVRIDDDDLELIGLDD